MLIPGTDRWLPRLLQIKTSNKPSSVCEMDAYVKQIDIAVRLVHKADRESCTAV